MMMENNYRFPTGFYVTCKITQLILYAASLYVLFNWQDVVMVNLLTLHIDQLLPLILILMENALVLF